MQSRSGVQSNEYLFAAMGSTVLGTSSYSIQAEGSLDPLGNYISLGWKPDDRTLTGNNTGSMQRLIMTTQGSSNRRDKFITLLYTHQGNAINPITEVVSSSGNYGIVISEATSNICSAVKSTDFIDFPQHNYRMTTNGDFFTVEANDDFSAVQQLIFSNGNSITVTDLSGARFTETILFNSESDQIDEVLAEWTDNKLNVTIKSANTLIPTYKILRSGALPENFLSKTEYGFEPNSLGESATTNRGTIDNIIEKLAYDNDYFYVNYTYAQLLSEGVIDADFYI
jgi:hypothetical protein